MKKKCKIEKVGSYIKKKKYIYIYIYILPPSHFVCPLLYFGMSQNIVLFLKIKVTNLLIFLLYPYFINNSIF